MLELHAALTTDGTLVLQDAQPSLLATVSDALETDLAACANPHGEDAGVALDDASMLALLEAVPAEGTPLLAPGIRVDDTLQVLARLRRVAGGLVVRQELLPDACWERDADGTPVALRARWLPLPSGTVRPVIDAIARALPAEALASQQPRLTRVQTADRVLARIVDALARRRLCEDAGDEPLRERLAPDASLHDRWLLALTTPDPIVTGPIDALDRLLEQLGRWQQRLRRPTESPFRLCLRLEEPDDPGDGDELRDPWRLRLLLQVREDPSLLVDVAETWKPTGATRILLQRLGYRAGEHLLAPLGEAAQTFEPLAEELRRATPSSCELTTEQAHAFLASVAPVLEQAGFGVFVPAWWRGADGARTRISLRARVHDGLSGGRRMLDSLNLQTLVGYDWRAAVGDAELTSDELQRLAQQKAGLVRIRGRWMELDPRNVQAALRCIERVSAGLGHQQADVGDLLRMAVGAHHGDVDAELDVVGVVDDEGVDLTDRLVQAAREQLPQEVPLPDGLRATLRPYQERGYAWLVTMAQLGLGACLADDMGLGKSVQALAAIQHAYERGQAAGGEQRASLIVAPTTVLGNWQREAARFTPELRVVVHHGPGRARGEQVAALAREADVVITSYALLARDMDALTQVSWQHVVLDEAQQIKNPVTQHARAARALRAQARVALTGTPVENHVGDLWSIMQFLNPGLLGTRSDFRRRYLLPIQTGALPEVVEQLRRVTAPFVLRREKSDPTVIDDLPDKLELTHACTLTREQASLYEAIVRETQQVLQMHRAQARMSGIERRGLILATIARLKQACNHPAQLLADGSAVAGRSGKLARLEELLETVLDRGERALVFTQFVAMGQLLQRRLADAFGREVAFLHGGVARAERDRMVARFQDPDPSVAPPILVLSLKAGGSGLNLTAATHVIHYDRWWNPAVEEQATDRAFRIGQQRDVQVHRLVCAGTVEERIDRMLTQKRRVARGVVGSGEQWIGDLPDEELMELLELRSDTLLVDGRLDDLDKEWRRASL